MRLARFKLQLICYANTMFDYFGPAGRSRQCTFMRFAFCVLLDTNWWLMKGISGNVWNALFMMTKYSWAESADEESFVFRLFIFVLHTTYHFIFWPTKSQSFVIVWAYSRLLIDISIFYYGFITFFKKTL